MRAVEVPLTTDGYGWALLLAKPGLPPRRLDAASDFVSSLVRAPRNTQEARARDLSLFFDFCLGGEVELDWRAANGPLVQRFVRALSETPAGLGMHANVRTLVDARKPKTIARVLSSVRGFYRWAHSAELITAHTRDLVVDVRGPRVTRRQSAERLYPDELERIFAAVADRPDMACVVGFLYGLGLRISGLLSLRFDDIHFDARVAENLGCRWPRYRAHVPHVHVRPRPDRELPKGVALKSAEYVVPASEPVLALYRSYLAHRLDVLGDADLCPFVFVSLAGASRGRALTRPALTKRFQRLADRVELIGGRRLHAHLLRHTFASEVRESDVVGDEPTARLVLQALLGHGSPHSQNVYVHPRADSMLRAVEQLSQFRSERGLA